MKKTNKILLLLSVCIVTATGVALCSCGTQSSDSSSDSSQNVTEEKKFTATISEIYDTTMVVVPVANSDEIKSSDQISVNYKDFLSETPKVNDKVEITYDGYILESYPAQLQKVYKIDLLKSADSSKDDENNSFTVSTDSTLYFNGKTFEDAEVYNSISDFVKTVSETSQTVTLPSDYKSPTGAWRTFQLDIDGKGYDISIPDINDKYVKINSQFYACDQNIIDDFCDYTYKFLESQSDKVEQEDTEVLLITIKTNTDGKQSGSFICNKGLSYALSEDFSFDNENWYEQLLNIQKNDMAENEIDNDYMTLIRQLNDDYDSYAKSELSGIEIAAADYGNDVLYGVYSDENGSHTYMKLCSYGNGMYCIDNQSAKDLINQLNAAAVISIGDAGWKFN